MRYKLGVKFVTAPREEEVASSSDHSEAIAPLRKTLRTFILYQDVEDVLEVDGIKALTQFDRLQNLVIGFDDLSGEDYYEEDSDTGSDTSDDDMECTETKSQYMNSLPKSLENLCIIDATRSLNSTNTLGRELLRFGKVAKTQFLYLSSLVADGFFDLRALFTDSGINYQEIKPGALKKSDLGLEEFFEECGQQMIKDRGHHGQQVIHFNRHYTRSILSYCVRSVNWSNK